MRGLRVMFATDFHIRDHTPDNYVAVLASMLAAQRADLLLLGGDYGESAAASKRFFRRWPGKIFRWAFSEFREIMIQKALKDILSCAGHFQAGCW